LIHSKQKSQCREYARHSPIRKNKREKGLTYEKRRKGLREKIQTFKIWRKIRVIEVSEE
jgi:hypothetical protein